MSGIFQSTTISGTWTVMYRDEVIADGLGYKDAMIAYSKVVGDRAVAAYEFLKTVGKGK